MESVKALHILLLFAAFSVPLVVFFCVCVYCGLTTRRESNPSRILYSMATNDYFQHIHPHPGHVIVPKPKSKFSPTHPSSSRKSLPSSSSSSKIDPLAKTVTEGDEDQVQVQVHDQGEDEGLGQEQNREVV